MSLSWHEARCACADCRAYDAIDRARRTQLAHVLAFRERVLRGYQQPTVVTMTPDEFFRRLLG